MVYVNYTSIIKIFEKLKIRKNFLKFISQLLTVGSLKLAMVGGFMPQKSTNTIN